MKFTVTQFMAACAGLLTVEVHAVGKLAAYIEANGCLPKNDADVSRVSSLGSLWPRHRERVLDAISQLLDQPLSGSKMVVPCPPGTKGQCVSAGENRQGVAAQKTSSNPTKDGEGVSVARQPHHRPPGALDGEHDVDLLGMIRGLADAKQLPPPRAPARRFESHWDWLRSNTTPEQATAAMRFVGWLYRTGTTDDATLLALVKHFVVHQPISPFAYYTPRGVARQSIAMRVAGDRAIAEHEQLKQQEREFLREGTDGARRQAET